jgi:PAS domain S-box-containing protein
LSDSTVTQTQTDLNKLRQLVDELNKFVDSSQQNYGASGQTWSTRQQRETVLPLLTQARLTLDSLSRSVEGQDKERRQMRALQDVSAAINSSLDQAEVLNMVMDSIIQLIGAERGFLMLHDPDTGELEVEVARNINRETIGESSFEISRSIVSSVAESGTPVVTTNAQEDERFERAESIISYNLRSILCVPLKIKDNNIGVIYADNRIMSGIFVNADRDLLAAFANQAAVAIENARLFQQIRDQLAAITEMKNLQDDVFGSIASGVITIDTTERISLFNRAAEQILGVSSREAIERNYKYLLTTSMGSIIEDLVEDIQQSGDHVNMEMEAALQNRTGTTTLSLTFSPLLDISQETLGVALVLDDVSEKKRLESVRRYLPPALVDQVQDVDAAQLGQRRTISVLFGDVRGWTSFSETLAPEELIEVLNGHFAASVGAINKYGGLIDKYDGDTVMALFNTRLNPQEDHVERCVRTALAMRDDLAAYHESVPEEERLYFGIGIHAGEAVVGNVGSPLRKDYSAIGDAVNVASRLQAIAKPHQIILSQDAYQQVKDLVTADELETVTVKGRQAPVHIYELTGLKS